MYAKNLMRVRLTCFNVRFVANGTISSVLDSSVAKKMLKAWNLRV